ncbi:Ubiquitin system component Cue [Macleaya cordata]|uniref:Ubiquitin system component Cue n=1 Tax=Macleaya cordata TaxID=56857 RepID=A0A200QKC5_MACCD|nr:Ubiquitin system component Cue [Macleaya cordata]
MASRSINNNSKQDGNKGFNRTPQMKFVPKNQNSIRREPINNPPLTTSLRDPAVSIINNASTSSSSRVQIGDNGDWVPSKKQGGNFVIYLPQDEAVAAGLGVEDGALDPVESQRVVDLLNRELSRLLKLSPRDFWREVASDTSLHDFLDSFLQFRNRWYDFPHHGAKGIVAGVIVGELELSRRVFMVLYRISSNKDPGALAIDSLSAKEHGALLQEKNLLNLPKLLDVCAIYGHENEELTRLLVMNAMKAQPRLHENLTAVVSHFLSITHTMHQRCNSSLEVMDFINDAVVSLDAFVNAYKPAAVYFSCLVEMSSGNGELLSTLARLHDSLLPSLQGGFRDIFSAGADRVQNSLSGKLPNIAIGLKMLSMRIVNLGWKLLESCYLSDAVLEESLPLPTSTKMFPAKVDDPGIRGDILVQTFREINGEASHHVWENKNSMTFLQNVEKYYKILSRLEDLRDNGWIFMDDEQFQYLSLIAMPPTSQAMNKESMPVSTVNKVQMDEDAAVTESKISQIKDLFPDYGSGFIAACLEVYNNNPEEVIQRILEGTLHEDLQSLDISLEKIPPPKSASSLTRNDKGKGILVEPTTTPSTNVVDRVQEQRNEVASSSFGRYTRKSKVDSSNSQTLDLRVGDESSVKTAILASQYEYEDEYDDSFDDLGLSFVETGFEETETLGDRISSTPGQSWRGESERPAQGNSGSKWNTQKKPQFYVKDGKNYSYKVSGSTAVANSHEAALVNQSQKELIHGLGRGGNLPMGAVRALTEINDHHQHQQDSVGETGESRGNPANSWGRGRRGGRGNQHQHQHQHQQNLVGETGESGGNPANSWGRGRGGVRGNQHQNQHPHQQDSVDVGEMEESGGNPANSRGRGRRGGGGNNYRKDRAMKKHFAGIGGGY